MQFLSLIQDLLNQTRGVGSSICLQAIWGLVTLQVENHSSRTKRASHLQAYYLTSLEKFLPSGSSPTTVLSHTRVALHGYLTNRCDGGR